MVSEVYQNRNAQSHDCCELKSEIKCVLEKEEIITDPRIRLSQFAEIINVSPKAASQIIKKEFKKGFNELLNKYRIQFAVERIEDGFLDVYTLEALGEQTGFSSRTTFFNAFKKELGTSPSEYWKKFQELPE